MKNIWQQLLLFFLLSFFLFFLFFLFSFFFFFFERERWVRVIQLVLIDQLSTVYAGAVVSSLLSFHKTRILSIFFCPGLAGKILRKNIQNSCHSLKTVIKTSWFKCGSTWAFFPNFSKKIPLSGQSTKSIYFLKLAQYENFVAKKWSL